MTARQVPCYTAPAMNTSAGRKTPSLKDFRRIVVKGGSSLLVDSSAGALKREWLASLVHDIAGLHKDKSDVLAFSSAAIAFGLPMLKLPAVPLKIKRRHGTVAI